MYQAADKIFQKVEYKNGLYFGKVLKKHNTYTWVEVCGS